MNIKRLLLCGLTATALLLQSLCVALAAESSMLYEDFSSSLGVMTAEGSGTTKLSVVDGKKVAELGYRASISYMPPKNAVDWNGSYQMTFRAKTDDWNTNDAPELIFRIHSEGSRTYYFNYSGGRVSLMRLLPEGQDMLAMTPADKAYIPEESQFNEFTVDAINTEDGVRCRVRINSVTVLDYTDMSSKTVRGGGITITSNKQNGDGFYIDDVTVTKIESSKTEIDTLNPSPDVLSDKYKNEYTVLRQLGIMPADENGMFNGDYILTRGEYVDAVVKMFTETPLRGKAYNDVNESSPFAESVYTAKIFGIIEDRPSFRPNDIIEFDDAVQILLKALGYYGLNTSKNSAGAWASKLGLMKGIDERNSKKATLAKLLFNALDVPIVNSVIKSGSAEYTTDKDDTVLSRRGIAKGRGVYSEDSVTCLTRKRASDDKTRLIGNTRVKTGVIDADSLLGMYVEYYTEEIDSDYPTLLYAAPVEQRNKVYEVRDRDIENVSKSSFSYMENGRLKRLDISRTADVIYNRIACPSFTAEDIKPKYGSVRLTDNDNDGKIDFIDVESYVSITVESVSAENNNGIVRGKPESGGAVFSLSREETDYEYISGGKSASSSEIMENDTLSVGESKDKSHCIIYISHKSVKTRVDGKNADGDIFAGEAVYKTTPQLDEYLAKNPEKKIKVGDEYILYIDYFGGLASFESNASPYMYVYLYNSENRTKRLKNSSAIEALGTDRVWRIYNLAENVSLNGVRMKNKDAIASAELSSGGECIRQLISVSLNSDGEVCGIKTAAETESPDMISKKSGEMKYRYYGEMFSEKSGDKYVPRYCIGKTPVFTVPTDGDKDGYDVSSHGEFSDGSLYRISLYDTEYGEPKACVYEYENSGRVVGEDRQLLVVSSVSCVSDDEEGECYRLEGFYDGGGKTLKITSDAEVYRTADNTKNTAKQPLAAESIQRGDILRFNTDIDGKANEVQVIHKRTDSDKSYYIDGTYEFICGTAVYNNTSRQYVALNIENSPLLTDDSIWLNMNQGGYVYIVESADRRKPEVRAASTADIEVNDRVFTWMRTNRPLATVIYRSN